MGIFMVKEHELTELLRHYNAMDAGGKRYIMGMAEFIAKQCEPKQKSPNLKLIVGGKETDSSTKKLHSTQSKKKRD